MIFITLGSQKFQFDCLLKAIDDLIEKGSITGEVFAQSGYSNYKPRHYKFKPFLDRDKFKEMVSKADIVITHGGTGTIIGAVKKGKKVIAVPRLAKYGEHVDNHQLQLIEQFDKLNLICKCLDVEHLDKALKIVREKEYNVYQSNTQRIITHIEEFIKR